jgi:membrane complex biogenesis BtpA family protein
MRTIEELFGRPKCLIGVVHLMPLPGSPGWGGSMKEIIDQAVSDARTLEDAGFDGMILENFGDAPFARGFAGRGAVAGMASVGACVADAVELPLGINVLRSDGRSAVAIAAAVGGRFIRVNVHVGAAVTDQGIIEGDAMATMLDVRDMAPGLAVFADVLVKHAVPLGGGTIEQAAADAVRRGGASALIVTGAATGAPASLGELERVKAAVPEAPVFVGSGVTLDTISRILKAADGIIIGSAIMSDGKAAGPIDRERALAIIGASRTG